VASVAEFDQNVQALLGGQRRVVARVGCIGILEAGKHPDRFLHARIIALGVPNDPGLPPRR